MAIEPSFVQKRRNYSDIAQFQDPQVLDEFLEQPATFIAETITGMLGDGAKGVSASGGLIVQTILKDRAYKQWSVELNRLRASGRIAPDFAEHKYGFQTWVELMTVIDEESPDGDRLEALKAMFYSVNKVEVEDGERIAAYQLWQIAKQLTSGELFLLKVLFEKRAEYQGTANHNH
jgi:hypothetical protein